MNRTAHTSNPLVEWLRQRATSLRTLEPEAPIDDLADLEQIVAGARVVAIGENSHFVPEFTLMRHRIIRLLVERCGFTVLAFESGFSEGFAVDAWVRGSGSETEIDRLVDTAFPSGTALPDEVRQLLRWVRRRSTGGDTPLHFVGIDVPEAAGSPLAALDPVRPYLEKVDPQALPLLDRARELARDSVGRTMAQAAPRYLEAAPERMDALTAVLSRIIDRFDALAPEYRALDGDDPFDIARWRLEGARAADHHLHAIAGASVGSAPRAAATARERYMAATVAWWMKRLGPGSKIVLAAHNAHIQRTPVVYGGEVQVLPMGLHLDRMLGSDYCPIGFTNGCGHTAGLRPDGVTEPYGFAIDEVELEPPEPGSIEAFLSAAGVDLGLVDLRAARGSAVLATAEHAPDRIRMDSDYIHTPVLEAFDGMVHVPSTSVAGNLGF